MKTIARFSCFVFLVLCTSAPRASAMPFVNLIEGTVFDPHHRPVPDLWVELQNDVNTTYGRVRTTNMGRFSFTGMRAGHYVIRVYTTGTEYAEQTESVDVVNVVQNASDAVYQDVTLRFKRENNASDSKTGAMFAQEVPAEAKRLFKDGVRDLQNKDLAKGRDELEQAIKLFPNYYEALDSLGCSYVATGDYGKSFPYLIQAINVNQRSFTSFYSLGYAAYKMNQIPEATDAARAAVTLQASSVNAQLLYGTVLRIGGKYDVALETLEKAHKLNKDAPIAEIHWQMALVLNKLNRNKEAADQLETYLRINPEAANKKEIQGLIAKLRNQTT